MKLFLTNLCALMWKDETILVKSGPGAVRDTLWGCFSRLKWSIPTPLTLPKIVNWILETILKVFLTKLCTLMWKVGAELIKSVQRFSKDTSGGCFRRLKWTVSLHFVPVFDPSISARSKTNLLRTFSVQIGSDWGASRLLQPIYCALTMDLGPPRNRENEPCPPYEL